MGRTPLFCACATNRSQCVAFLCSVAEIGSSNLGATPIAQAKVPESAPDADSGGGSLCPTPANIRLNSRISWTSHANMMKQSSVASWTTDDPETQERFTMLINMTDKRGDNSAHAAACNGSLASLQIIAEFGIDLKLKNKQGFTASDLAIMNGHHSCRDFLQSAILQIEHDASNLQLGVIVSLVSLVSFFLHFYFCLYLFFLPLSFFVSHLAFSQWFLSFPHLFVSFFLLFLWNLFSFIFLFIHFD